MSRAVPAFILGTLAGLAVSAASKKEKKRKGKKAPSDDDIVIEEEVPPPSDSGFVTMSGSQQSEQYGPVDWWVAAYKGKYGWQFSSADGAEEPITEMSYKDGVIYRYDTDQAALHDLMEVIK